MMEVVAQYQGSGANSLIVVSADTEVFGADTSSISGQLKAANTS